MGPLDAAKWTFQTPKVCAHAQGERHSLRAAGLPAPSAALPGSFTIVHKHFDVQARMQIGLTKKIRGLCGKLHFSLEAGSMVGWFGLGGFFFCLFIF